MCVKRANIHCGFILECCSQSGWDPSWSPGGTTRAIVLSERWERDHRTSSFTFTQRTIVHSYLVDNVVRVAYDDEVVAVRFQNVDAQC